MDSTGLAMERRFKCCNKDFSHYLCIECMGVFHKSCAARMRHVKELTSYKIYCSRLCEQTYEKKLKHQETIVVENGKLQQCLEEKEAYLEKISFSENDDIINLRNELSDLRKEVADRDTYIDKIKKQMRDFEDEVMESEIKYLEDFNQQKNIIKKLHDEIKSLNDNNNELKKQIDDHNAELVKGKRELEEMIEIN
nr:unnamed protein product [Callosobruchus analis]